MNRQDAARRPLHCARPLAVSLVTLATLAALPIQQSLALPAFPGAEGFGTTTPGGRGGRVIVVTNRNNSGPGSFREALQATGPRIIVFRVSGVIDISGDIQLTTSNSFVTVLGQSSPGGITLVNGAIYTYQSSFHDAVFRFLRLRSQSGDTFAFNPVYNLVLDHIDMSGGADETFDVDYSRDYTVQWSTITNSKSGSGSQNYGALIAYRPTSNVTFHHNLSAHHLGRCGAQFHWSGGGALPADGANLDLRNNVFYNCGSPEIWRMDLPPNEGLNWNVVGNYAKAGPNTPSNARLSNITGSVYMTDNSYPGNSIGGSPNRSQPHAFPFVTTTSAAQAFDDVLAYAGSWPRDAMALRTIDEVRNGTGRLGKLDDPLDTDTGPAPPQDTDVDGLPDSWETANGLDPNNRDDSAQLHSSGYAFIEVYLNEIAEQITGQTPPATATPLAPTNLTVN